MEDRIIIAIESNNPELKESVIKELSNYFNRKHVRNTSFSLKYKGIDIKSNNWFAEYICSSLVNHQLLSSEDRAKSVVICANSTVTSMLHACKAGFSDHVKEVAAEEEPNLNKLLTGFDFSVKMPDYPTSSYSATAQINYKELCCYVAAHDNMLGIVPNFVFLLKDSAKNDIVDYRIFDRIAWECLNIFQNAWYIDMSHEDGGDGDYDRYARSVIDKIELTLEVPMIYLQ